MREDGLDDVPLVVGGIIPPEDAAKLKSLGVAAVFTPKDFQLNAIMRDIVRLVDRVSQRRREPRIATRRVSTSTRCAAEFRTQASVPPASLR